MSRSDEPTSLHPLPDPAEDQAAAVLADVLTSEAARIEPTDRLADIRAAGAKRGLSWAPVAAAVAFVVAIGGGTWALVERNAQGQRPVGSATPAPTPAPDPPPPTPSPTSSTAAAGTWAAPIYYPGRSASGLYREFHALPVTPGPMLSHVGDALKVAMDPSSPQRAELEFSPWLEGTSRSFQLSSGGADTIVVRLPASETSARGATVEQARLAAQQLVWTATAVAQDPGLGVRITFVAGSGKLFGVLATDRIFRRPPAASSYQDLSAIWITQPDPGATVRNPVVVSGSACTFEANVAWQVLRGTTVVKSGHTTASQACPVRSPWSVTVKGLAAGSYTFRAFEQSAKGDGTYEGLDTTPFTVR